MPPFLMAAIRFAIAGAILVALDLLRHPEARRLPTRRQVLDSLIVGGLLLGIGNGFVTFGELTVPSGIAAILIAMIPLWFALLGWLYFRERLPRIVVLRDRHRLRGHGAACRSDGRRRELVRPARHRDPAPGPDRLGARLDLLGQRRAKLPPSPLTASGLQMLAGARVCVRRGLIIGEPARFHPEAISTASILAVVYLVVFGSMVAYTTYAWLLRNAPLSLVGTYAYVNPVVAVALGTMFLGETLSLRTIVASAIILAAVAIIVTGAGAAVLGATSRPRRADAASRAPRRAGTPRARRQAGCPSASTVRLTRRAIAITVSIGFTPMPVGNVELSAT